MVLYHTGQALLQEVLDSKLAHTSFGKLPLSDEKTSSAFSHTLIKPLALANVSTTINSTLPSNWLKHTKENYRQAPYIWSKIRQKINILMYCLIVETKLDFWQRSQSDIGSQRSRNRIRSPTNNGRPCSSK